MRKKDEIKLDALSQIDDEIIEKNTQKRNRLMNKKFAPRRMISTYIAAAIALVVIVPILILLFSKQVPVYEGMTVSNYMSHNAAEYVIPDQKGYSFDYLSNDKGDNGNHYGHDKKPVENIVEEDTSISLEIPEQQMYYATPGKEIYITVHISNPDSFEILSFTLNGKKYSSYMFEHGSDMENLILKVDVGNEAGIREYTIDAIKYVDGTEIKDVVMKGDRTVKVGVYTEGIQPTASITNELIGINDISFDVNLADEFKLIEKSGGMAFAVVADEDSILGYQEISVGDEHIRFDGLERYTEYRYGVVAYYDTLGGGGMEIKIIYQKEFTTQSVVAVSNLTATQTSAEFSLAFSEYYEKKAVSSMALYHGEERILDFDVSGDVIGRVFEATDLLSNNEYRIVVTYEFNGAVEEIEFRFTTQKMAEPVFEFSEIIPDIDSIVGSYELSNVDNTLISYTVSLYKSGELIKESTDKKIEFDSLDYYNDYTVRITYTFDLNDGNGVQEMAANRSVRTLPYIDVLECNIANTSAVSEGDTIFMQVKLDNPHNMAVESVVVNGETYDVAGSSTTNKIFVEIVYNGQFAGGDTYLKIDKVNAKIDSTAITVAPKSELADNVFINGTLEVLKIEYVNDKLEPIEWSFNSDTVYLMVTLDNPTGYTVNSINSITEGITQLDSSRVYCTISSEYSYYGWNDFNLSSLSYYNDYVQKSITFSDVHTRYFRVASDDTVYVSSPEDLKKMYDPDGESTGYYYELTNDIDLSGYEWVGYRFRGVFDGKGYSIKNMSFVSTVKNCDAALGLFSSADGIIQNLHIRSATIIADLTSDDGRRYNAYCGGIVAHANSSIIRNCSVDGDSIFSIKNNTVLNGNDMCESYLGGIAARVDYGEITNCSNGGSLTIVGATCNAGGIAGAFGYGVVSQCSNSGGVTVSSTIDQCTGGLFGSVYNVSLINCINTGDVNVNQGSDVYAGGLIGKSDNSNSSDSITSCINIGQVNVVGQSGMVGGLIGYHSDGAIRNCVSASKLTYKGGISQGSLSGNDNVYKSFNSYSRYSYVGLRCTDSQLNTKEFYTAILGWSEDIWDLSDLNFKDGKYPKLK